MSSRQGTWILQIQHIIAEANTIHYHSSCHSRSMQSYEGLEVWWTHCLIWNCVSPTTAVEQSIMNVWISWSAYHADAHKAVIPPAAINALLPLFLDNAHSAAMIRHSMDIVRAAVQHLNPGQTPVPAADQPMYVLAPCLQEEANTRLLLNAADAVQTGVRR